MFRGSRVQVPPLHSVADVLGLCLLVLILYLILRWVLGGGSPFQELSGWLSPAKLSTLLEIELGLAMLPAELAGLLPAREKGSRSAALELAQRTGEALLRERACWQSGSVHVMQVKETEGSAAWDAAWRHAYSEENLPAKLGPPSVVVLALLTGRTLQAPDHPTLDDVERFVRGLGQLDVRNLDAFGALSVPAAATDLRPSA